MSNPDTRPGSGSKPQTRAINILSGGIGNYPIKLELVPKRLVVSIYQQELLGRGSHIPCWIFVTQGMQAFKQKEFVLAMRIEDPEDFKKFPKAPVQLFMHLFKAVAQKKRFHIGSITPLGEKGLMGFAGLGYTHQLITTKELQLPLSHLTCVFLTREELLAARSLGLTRVLARMGFESNRFPINPWNEMKRSGTAMHAVIKDSQFKGIASLVLDHCSVNLVNGDTVALVLSPLAHAPLMKFLKEHAKQSHLGFITQLFSYHEGALAWLPMKDTVEMNLHPDADGELIAGSFLIVSRDDHSGATMLEDGFRVMLDTDGWHSFQQAINGKQNAQVKSSGGDMAFEIVWNLSRNTDTNSGLTTIGNVSNENEGESGGLMGKVKSLFKR
jgi:hypothetical protein